MQIRAELDHLLDDPEELRVEVDIGPAQTHELASLEASDHRHAVESGQSIGLKT